MEMTQREGWVDCVYMDSGKASDTASHDAPTVKIREQADITGQVERRISGYLNRKVMITVIRGSCSS